MTTTTLFTNRATAKLAVAVASIDTALTLVPGGGDWFPSPGANEFFRLVLQKGSAQNDQREYMICTSRTGDVLTVTRGQEGTPAANFAVADEVSLVATALTMGNFVQKVGQQLQGALTVEAPPTVALGIATKAMVDAAAFPEAPQDTKDYARRDAAWHALGAAAGLAVPIPITAGGTGGTTLPQAQLNLIIGLTSIDDLAPASPKYGDRWIKPSNMTEMVWVPNQGGGGTGVWVNPADAQSEAYPISIAKGGTGAITAPAALTNLGGTTVGKAVFTAADTTAGQNALGATTVGKGVFTAATQLAGRAALGIVESTTSPWLLSDGTVAAPGLAWASEPGMGLYRASAAQLSIASGGAQVFNFHSVGATATYLVIGPRADGSSNFQMWRTATANRVNTDFANIAYDVNGLTISTEAAGTGTKKQISLFTPAGLNFVIGGRTVSLDASANYTSAGEVTAANFRTAGTVFAGAVNAGGGTITTTGTVTGGAVTSTGNVTAANDLKAYAACYLDNGSGTALIGINASGGYPKLRWTGDNWRVEWQSGYMRYYTPSNAVLFTWDATGSFQQASANAYKPGGGSWADSSDARVKHDIRDYRHGLREVLALRPRVFKFKEETGRAQEDFVGLVFQEAGAMPELQIIKPNKLGEIELDDMGHIDASAITYALINAVKTLHERINQLENR